MKTLLLLRHARPSQTSPTGRDFDRPLVEAGRADARLVGHTLRQRNLAPEAILSSSAVRARETTEIVREAAQLSTPPRFDERLFDATAERLVRLFAEAADDPATLLVVAHNPGIAELILHLTGANVPVKPGTLSRVDLDIRRWRDLRPDTTGQLVFTLAPGEQ